MLVAFSDDAIWGLFDHIRMQNELEGLLERRIDLICKRAIEKSQNSIRRKEKLGTAEIYFSINEVVPKPPFSIASLQKNTPFARTGCFISIFSKTTRIYLVGSKLIKVFNSSHCHECGKPYGLF